MEKKDKHGIFHYY